MAAMPARPSSLPVVPAAAARRLFMRGQGLLADPARRTSPSAVYQQIARMGFVQVDTINVVERAHHHILCSRFDDYRPHMLTKLLEHDRKLFEHWTHDAAVIPTEWFGHWRERFARYRRYLDRHPRFMQRMGSRPRRMIAQVRDRIERDGPLMSKDFERKRKRKSAGWWDWKPQKVALEYLWRTGELAIAKRVNFQKVYDLTGRVLPHVPDGPTPPEDAYVAWACQTALERLGVATPAEISRYLSAVTLPEAKRWCGVAAAAGEIVEVVVEAVDGSAPRPAYAPVAWQRGAARAADAPARLRLLSPFDPLIHDRARTRRLFGFDYTIEVFVPAAKRRYGYFVLPILEGERFVGRADAKFHRDKGTFAIQGLWWEAGVKPTKVRRRRLDAAVGRLAEQIGADDFTLPPP